MMMLKPFPAHAMEAYPVGARVGTVKHDDAGLVEPMATQDGAMSKPCA